MRIGRYDVAVTNLDKVFFPASGLTKGDLVRHYVDLGDYILPHVGHRPMQMLRYPHGVEGDFFYQKRVPNPHPDWLETVHIVFPERAHGRLPGGHECGGPCVDRQPRLHRSAHLALPR